RSNIPLRLRRDCLRSRLSRIFAPLISGHGHSITTGQADELMTIGDATDAVLAPPVSLRASVIVRQVIPRRAVWAIVFADRSPRALTQVRTPSLPVRPSFA